MKIQPHDETKPVPVAEPAVLIEDEIEDDDDDDPNGQLAAPEIVDPAQVGQDALDALFNGLQTCQTENKEIQKSIEDVVARLTAVAAEHDTAMTEKQATINELTAKIAELELANATPSAEPNIPGITDKECKDRYAAAIETLQNTVSRLETEIAADKKTDDSRDSLMFELIELQEKLVESIDMQHKILQKFQVEVRTHSQQFIIETSNRTNDIVEKISTMKTEFESPNPASGGTTLYFGGDSLYKPFSTDANYPTLKPYTGGAASTTKPSRAQNIKIFRDISHGGSGDQFEYFSDSSMSSLGSGIYDDDDE